LASVALIVVTLKTSRMSPFDLLKQNTIIVAITVMTLGEELEKIPGEVVKARVQYLVSANCVHLFPQ
jgi:hypothetical protein